MYNSFFILIAGTLPFLIAGLPAGYYLNRKYSKSPAPETTFAYAVFFGYIFYAVPSMYLARPGMPVGKFAWFLPAAAVLSCSIFLGKMRKKGFLKRLVPPVWFVIAAVLVFSFLNFGFLAMDPIRYRMDDFSDLRYYAAAGEAWKTIPHSEWKMLYAKDNTLWLSWASICNDGMERICPVLMFSLISAWAHVDASAVSGAVGNLAVLFVFCGAVTFIDGMEIKDFSKGVMAVGAALCPMVVISMLNCFIPMTMLVGGTLFACTFFVRFLEKPDIPGSIFAGIFIAVFIETVLDGLYVLLGLYVLTAASLIFAGKMKIRDLRYSLITFLCVPVTVLPVLCHLLTEFFGTRSVRTDFNIIYHFVYSRIALTYAYFGTRLTDRGSRYIFVVTIASFVLLFMGVTGLVIAFLRTKKFRYTNILAVFALSFIFLALDCEAQYAFYKVFQLSFPGLLIGAWILLSGICRELFGIGKKTGYRRFIFAAYGLFACALITEGYSVGMSCGHLLRCSIEYTNERDSNANRTYLTENGRPDWETLLRIRKLSGHDLLYVSSIEESHAQTLFSYFGRDNHIWYMNPETYDCSKIRGYGWEKVTPGCSVPEDAEIYVEAGKENVIRNQEDRENLVSVLSVRESGGKAPATFTGRPVSGIEQITFDFFSRESRTVRLVLGVTAEDGSGEVILREEGSGLSNDQGSLRQEKKQELSAGETDSWDGSAVRLVSGEAGEIILHLEPGSTRIVLAAEGEETVTVNSCRVESVHPDS